MTSLLSSRGGRRGDLRGDLKIASSPPTSAEVVVGPRNDKKPLISILIVTFNRWDLLKDCLESIQNQSYANVETIVVDNGSDEATREGLKYFKSVCVLRPNKNLGFAGGNNLATKEASGDYLFLLNNDAFLGRNTLNDLVAYAQKHLEVSVAQPTILIGPKILDTRYQIPSRSNGAGSFLTKWGFLWHRGLRQKIDELPQQPDPIFSALGAGMLIRRDVVTKHGLFDESFFAYFEETDFCWRLWTRGERASYVPTDPMSHLGSQTAKVFNEKVVIFFAYRNRLISFWRHLELAHLLQVLFFHHLAILGLIVVLLPKRPAASGWMLMVLLWEFTHPLTLLKTRAQHLRRRTVSDHAIWPAIHRPISLHQMLNYLR